ncbi:MAG: protein tyrosine phosphatase [Proteobacteria bacterium]|nr:protein tyrosine phosphatase [Pseudomonadota bacterium]
MIHVCPLARLQEVVQATGARHVATLLGDEANMRRPDGVAEKNHLWLRMHDISVPMDGYITPEDGHVERLIAFVRDWDQAAPVVVHCYAGISRSTAAAFVSVCALNPQRTENEIAQALRRSSATALPNIRIVTIADHVMNRGGRMVAAIEAIGRTMPTIAAEPFQLDIERPRGAR